MVIVEYYNLDEKVSESRGNTLTSSYLSQYFASKLIEIQTDFFQNWEETKLG